MDARKALSRTRLNHETLLAWGREHSAALAAATSRSTTFILEWRYVRVVADWKEGASLVDCGEVLPNGRLPDLRADMEEHWGRLAQDEPAGTVRMTWEEFTRNMEARYAGDPGQVAHSFADYRLMAARHHHLETGPVTVDKLMAWGEEKAYVLGEAPPSYRECGCLGPSGGEPVCPCRMRHVAMMDGRWVSVRGSGEDMQMDDLGEVTPLQRT